MKSTLFSKAFCLLIVVTIPFIGQAQSYSDCVNAISVCATNIGVDSDSTDIGSGGIAELQGDTISKCLGNGENNSIWFNIEIAGSGTLTFDIVPTGTADYDFALFNITQTGCQGIIDGLAPEVRCSYTYGTGTTGLRPTYVDTISGTAGSQFLAPLSVQAGEVYALLVDKFLITHSGFDIQFTGTATFPPPSSACQTNYIPLSINAPEQTAAPVVFFENPVKGKVLKIILKSTEKENQLRLYNLSGQLIENRQNLVQGTNEMDMSHFSPGIYIAQFVSESTVVSKKVVVR